MRALSLPAKDIALNLGTAGPHKTLATSRKISILFNGQYFVSSVQALYVWEHPFYPQFYIHRRDLLTDREHIKFIKSQEFNHPETGVVLGTSYNVTSGDRIAPESILIFADNLSGPAASLSGLVRIQFDAMDQWFEEDTPIFIHPKDPFKRIDVLSSSRPIRIIIDGQIVAEAAHSMHLYETGLPCRYYLPRRAIRQDVLRPSSTVTHCPYKGSAEYFSVEVDGKLHEDIVWFYDQPLIECAKIEGTWWFPSFESISPEYRA
jgi:uncharacterized protein (DUF427 family)